MWTRADAPASVTGGHDGIARRIRQIRTVHPLFQQTFPSDTVMLTDQISTLIFVYIMRMERTGKLLFFERKQLLFIGTEDCLKSFFMS